MRVCVFECGRVLCCLCLLSVLACLLVSWLGCVFACVRLRVRVCLCVCVWFVCVLLACLVVCLSMCFV